MPSLTDGVRVVRGRGGDFDRNLGAGPASQSKHNPLNIRIRHLHRQRSYELAIAARKLRLQPEAPAGDPSLEPAAYQAHFHDVRLGTTAIHYVYSRRPLFASGNRA